MRSHARARGSLADAPRKWGIPLQFRGRPYGHTCSDRVGVEEGPVAGQGDAVPVPFVWVVVGRGAMLASTVVPEGHGPVLISETALIFGLRVLLHQKVYHL